MRTDDAWKQLLAQLAGGLIVSCQAHPGEPLHGTGCMVAMARAAAEGGAVAIRANGADDIRAIKQEVGLPVIGIVKRDYPGSPVYITPTLREVEEVVSAGADIVATDATSRPRPGGGGFTGFLQSIRERFDIPVMADCATVEDARRAAEAGVELVATTLVGYTDESDPGDPYRPDFDVVAAILAAAGKIPVIVEGRIWDPQDARRCLEMGAFAIVIGSAITRPQLITRRFVEALPRAKGGGGDGAVR